MPIFGLLNREWNSSTKKVSISQYTHADSGADSRVDSRVDSRAIFLAMRIRPQDRAGGIREQGAKHQSQIGKDSLKPSDARVTQM